MLQLFLILVSSVLPSPEQAELLQVFRDEFVAITPGKGQFPASFLMGCKSDETPQVRIEMSGNFAIGKYEVPQNLWQAVMPENPSRWKGPRNSVEMLSLSEAQTFCERATKLMRGKKIIKLNQEIRLPTETEWEYVTRAGTQTAYSFGSDKTKLDDYAWSTHNAAGNDPPVGAKKPNPWGLYDVHGYLWEWCISDTKKADSSEKGVIRGGGWKDAADKLKSCSRAVVAKDLRDAAVGLRCVLAPTKSP